MTATATRSWFGIRTIYLFGQKKDGTNVFEERIVVFSASTEEEAFAKAEQEADQYANAGSRKLHWHPWMEAYQQDGDGLIEGYEVWSELYESSESLESFVKSRYEHYNYHHDS